jgi:hypothetical protein
MAKNFLAKAAAVAAGLAIALTTSVGVASADPYSTKVVTGTSVSFAHYVERFGTPNTATVHVTAETNKAPSGSVTIHLSGNGVSRTWHKSLSRGTASQGLPGNLPVGTYTVSASYAGNNTYEASSGASHFSVMKARGNVRSVNARNIHAGQHGVVQGYVNGSGHVSITVKRGKTVVARGSDSVNRKGYYYAVLKTFPHRGRLNVTVHYSGDRTHTGDNGYGSFTVSR